MNEPINEAPFIEQLTAASRYEIAHPRAKDSAVSPKTYDANLTVERMRARRRAKVISRALRRNKQKLPGIEAADRRKGIDIDAPGTVDNFGVPSPNQRSDTFALRKRIAGLEKMRGMLYGFLSDTQNAFGEYRVMMTPPPEPKS